MYINLNLYLNSNELCILSGIQILFDALPNQLLNIKVAPKFGPNVCHWNLDNGIENVKSSWELLEKEAAIWW